MSSAEDYTVGWICALRIECVAAQSFLDEEHTRLAYQDPKDNNDYTLGKIGDHNVVIAVLPMGEYGTTSAAIVARDMIRSFPNIRIGLMVGIGGGAPTPQNDIRLGDVVVGISWNGQGEVLQYDSGRAIQSRKFQRIPPQHNIPFVLQTAVHSLLGQYERKGHNLQEAIEIALQNNKRMRKKYGRPDSYNDRLYTSAYEHTGDQIGVCSDLCGDDPTTTVHRDIREEDEDDPAIHYGTIASANSLMMDALMRDALAKEHNVLCFEMEAAGLLRHFPCLVIRGMCDYSDTHKNNQWQGYAAMTAAAYAKDLLIHIALRKIEAERKISDILSSVEQNVHEIHCDVEDFKTSQRQEHIDRWLSPSTNYNKALQQHQEGTGMWFLESSSFERWKKQEHSLLWLHGIPGCGKTVLSSTIIQNLEESHPENPLLYFYFDFNDSGKQTLDSVVRLFTSQLYRKRKETQTHLDVLLSTCENGCCQPSCESLCKVLLKMINQIKEVWIVLDALDECHTQKGLLSWIRVLLDFDQRNVHLLVTSRPEQDIRSVRSDIAHKDDVVPIQSDLISGDIRRYIHAEVREGNGLKRWRCRPDVLKDIETRLMEKADGMFRWVACQTDALEDCLDYHTLQDALATLSETLDETYSRILKAIPPNHKLYAIRILQFLTYSKRPLRIDEAVDAIAVDTEGVPYFHPINRMPDPEEISLYCSSLVVMVTTTGHSHDLNNLAEGHRPDDKNKLDKKHMTLQLAHFSVKEYLMSDRLDGAFTKHFQKLTASASIAKVCLAYLLHLDE